MLGDPRCAEQIGIEVVWNIQQKQMFRLGVIVRYRERPDHLHDSLKDRSLEYVVNAAQSDSFELVC